MDNHMDPAHARTYPLGSVQKNGSTVTAHLTLRAAVDRYDPPRTWAHVEAERYHLPGNQGGFRIRIIGGLDAFPRARGAMWTISDADRLIGLYYTAGYHETHRYVGLCDAGPSVLGGHGPSHTYHLTITSHEGDY